MSDIYFFIGKEEAYDVFKLNEYIKDYPKLEFDNPEEFLKANLLDQIYVRFDDRGNRRPFNMFDWLNAIKDIYHKTGDDVIDIPVVIITDENGNFQFMVSGWCRLIKKLVLNQLPIMAILMKQSEFEDFKSKNENVYEKIMKKHLEENKEG